MDKELLDKYSKISVIVIAIILVISFVGVAYSKVFVPSQLRRGHRGVGSLAEHFLILQWRPISMAFIFFSIMNNSADMKLFAAELRTDLPTLDLHGRYPAEALEQLELFLYYQNKAGESVVKVIYGGGSGRLGEAVRKRLQTHPLVDKIQDIGGSCLVLLNNK